MKIQNNFDFLRLAASTMVLTSHQFILNGMEEPLIFGHTLGYFAVFIFFIISGYWVTKSYKEESIFFRFIVKRLLRLIPGLTFCVLICFFIIGPIGFSGDIKNYFETKEYWKFLRNIFFISKSELQGIFEKNPYPNTLNGSLWTLSIEFKWYLILAILGYFRIINKKIVFLIILFSIIYWIYINYFNYEHKNFKVFFYLGNFFLTGVLLFLIELNLFILIISLLFSIFLLLFKFYYLGLLVGLPPLIIYVGLQSFKYLSKISRIGDLSYGVYLFAFPIQQTIFYFFGLILNFYISFLLVIVLTYSVAYFSWHFIELPFLRLKKKLNVITN
jgi:peptidoglycan/LPS O-acetylase OafA/YrhL